MARSKAISSAEARKESALTIIPHFPELRFDTSADFLHAYKTIFNMKNDLAREMHRICYSVPEGERAPYLNALERFHDNSLRAIEKGKLSGIIEVGAQADESGPLEIIWNLEGRSSLE